MKETMAGWVTVRELKAGEFFARKPLPNPSEHQVYIRGAYDREQRKYECQRFDDVGACVYLKGDTKVFTGFTF